MKKILAICVALSLVAALIYFMLVGQWLWARLLGVLSLILLPFSAWRRKSKGLSTVLWCLLIVAFAWVGLWLYPVGKVNDTIIVLLTILVVATSLLESYRESRWHRKNRGRAETQDRAVHQG